MYCSSLRTDVLHTVVALGWCPIAMSNIVHMALHVAVFFFFFFLFLFLFFIHNHLVRVIEGPDNRGPDNRGYTVLYYYYYYL